MTKTVYVFGAGINRSLCGWQGSVPPLATDLFQLALNLPNANYTSSPQSWWLPIFDYIKRYWKLSVDDLKKNPFDLEECFTLLQLQAKEAEKRGDFTEAQRLIEIISRLTVFFSQYLEKSSLVAGVSAVDFITLGKVIWKEQASVITFNYDTLIEESIESASGANATMSWLEIQPIISALQDGEENSISYDVLNEVPDEVLAYSRGNWERNRAYGVKFDEVFLRPFLPGILVDGRDYYKQQDNRQCQPMMLKMHGSLNWGRYVRHIQRKQNPSAPPRSIANGTTILGKQNGWRIAVHNLLPVDTPFAPSLQVVTNDLHLALYFSTNRLNTSRG